MSNKVYFYSRPNCLLCDEAETLLLTYQAVYNYEIVKKNIEDDPQLLEKYFIEIPVVKIKNEEITAQDLNPESLDQFIKKNLP